MRILLLLLIATIINNQFVFADEVNEDECAQHEEQEGCNSQGCNWNEGYCLNQCDCNSFSPEECVKNSQCGFTEVDNGSCSVKNFGCADYGHDECVATADYCVWTSNSICTTLPGFDAGCSNKTAQECQSSPQYCSYSARCVNNLFPSKTWDLCKEDCQANPLSTWTTFQPAYCVDNVRRCESLNVTECLADTGHCAIEYIYNESDIDTYHLNQCSDKDSYKYSQKCKALLFGCGNLSIDDCLANEYCLVIPEIGQCYPKVLPNCNTLTPEECLNYPNCCLDETCSNLPGIGENCPQLTPDQCTSAPECTLVDQGNCADIAYNCSLSHQDCLNQTDHCTWSSDVTAQCYNLFQCEGLNESDCETHCDVCDWQRHRCGHKP